MKVSSPSSYLFRKASSTHFIAWELESSFQSSDKERKGFAGKGGVAASFPIINTSLFSRLSVLDQRNLVFNTELFQDSVFKSKNRGKHRFLFDFGQNLLFIFS